MIFFILLIISCFCGVLSDPAETTTRIADIIGLIKRYNGCGLSNENFVDELNLNAICSQPFVNSVSDDYIAKLSYDSSSLLCFEYYLLNENICYSNHAETNTSSLFVLPNDKVGVQNFIGKLQSEKKSVHDFCASIKDVKLALTSSILAEYKNLHDLFVRIMQNETLCQGFCLDRMRNDIVSTDLCDIIIWGYNNLGHHYDSSSNVKDKIKPVSEISHIEVISHNSNEHTFQKSSLNDSRMISEKSNGDLGFKNIKTAESNLNLPPILNNLKVSDSIHVTHKVTPDQIKTPGKTEPTELNNHDKEIESATGNVQAPILEPKLSPPVKTPVEDMKEKNENGDNEKGFIAPEKEEKFKDILISENNEQISKNNDNKNNNNDNNNNYNDSDRNPKNIEKENEKPYSLPHDPDDDDDNTEDSPNDKLETDDRNAGEIMYHPPVDDGKRQDVADDNLDPQSIASNFRRDPLVVNEDSHFFMYFVSMGFFCIIMYILFHNKKKILALAVEGRRGRQHGGGRRRPNTAAYSKLDSNLEEAMVSNVSQASVTHVLY